jgi:hypothetical protein
MGKCLAKRKIPVSPGDGIGFFVSTSSHAIRRASMNRAPPRKSAAIGEGIEVTNIPGPPTLTAFLAKADEPPFSRVKGGLQYQGQGQSIVSASPCRG